MSLEGIAQNRFIRTLYDIEVGLPVRVMELRCEPALCLRLREMGFCELAEVSKVTENGALICHLCHGRVALSKRLAKNIIVEAIDTRRAIEK